MIPTMISLVKRCRRAPAWRRPRPGHWRERWASLASLACLLFSAGCVAGRPSAQAPQPGGPAVAHRLVLALDGIDYRDILKARERGFFAEFRPPSRLVSTFPSISDVAWHDIFGILPPRGYQRIYYSASHNAMRGTTLDAIRPIEFEDRMDMAFGTKFHHLSAYLASNQVARNEVSTAVRDFFRITGRPTVYVYNVGPDALQHTRGDLMEYLAHLDERLRWLQRAYREQTGESLEIVLLSDHGHNHVANARFIPVAQKLKARGFNAALRLESATDVAFSVDGVTTGFGVFASTDSVPVVAAVIAAVDGIELVTSQRSPTSFDVQGGSSTARVESRFGEGLSLYRYLPLTGDPLRYALIVDRMARDGVLDADGFADASTWLRYTADARYPAAPERIVRGHTAVTLNPAPILVSVSSGGQVGLGLVSVMNKLRPLGGTHGGLDADNSLGVVMSNFVETHDDVTGRVREQFGGFADLGMAQSRNPGARLTTVAEWSRDPRRTPYSAQAFRELSSETPLLEAWLNADLQQWATESGQLVVEIFRRASVGKTLEVVAVFAGAWIPAEDGRTFALPLSTVTTTALVPSTGYILRVGVAQSGRRGAAMRNIVALDVTTDAKGFIWP